MPGTAHTSSLIALLGLTLFLAAQISAAQNTTAQNAVEKASAQTTAEEAPFPSYKPASRAPEPMDIRTNAYGASRAAPEALEIGDKAADFVVPRAGGGTLSLQTVRARGPVVIIFYRGHW